jgi:hypothetical protein
VLPGGRHLQGGGSWRCALRPLKSSRQRSQDMPGTARRKFDHQRAAMPPRRRRSRPVISCASVAALSGRCPCGTSHQGGSRRLSSA